MGFLYLIAVRNSFLSFLHLDAKYATQLGEDTFVLKEEKKAKMMPKELHNCCACDFRQKSPQFISIHVKKLAALLDEC